MIYDSLYYVLVAYKVAWLVSWLRTAETVDSSIVILFEITVPKYQTTRVIDATSHIAKWILKTEPTPKSHNLESKNNHNKQHPEPYD